jgi:small subunit ribosomal protein S21
MAEVILSDTDRIEYALKTFKRKVQRAGILKDLRARRYYLKPSLARKLKKAAAQRRKHRARKSGHDSL